MQGDLLQPVAARPSRSTRRSLARRAATGGCSPSRSPWRSAVARLRGRHRLSGRVLPGLPRRTRRGLLPRAPDDSVLDQLPAPGHELEVPAGLRRAPLNSLLTYMRRHHGAAGVALLYSRNTVVVHADLRLDSLRALPISAGPAVASTELLESAADLGARFVARASGRYFSAESPRVLASFFMVFIPTVGEYVTPLLIGGSRGSMYGNIIQDFFTKAANWPRGAALVHDHARGVAGAGRHCGADRQRAQTHPMIALPQGGGTSGPATPTTAQNLFRRR